MIEEPKYYTVKLGDKSYTLWVTKDELRRIKELLGLGYDPWQILEVEETRRQTLAV